MPIASNASSNVLFSCPLQRHVSKSGNQWVGDVSAMGIDDLEDQPGDQPVFSMTSTRPSHSEPAPNLSIPEPVISRPEKGEMPARVEGEQSAIESKVVDSTSRTDVTRFSAADDSSSWYFRVIRSARPRALGSLRRRRRAYPREGATYWISARPELGLGQSTF